MRKLILQMQFSLDSFVCDENGNTDGFIWNWDTEWNWDEELQNKFIQLHHSIDCILLSRKMADQGFIEYWNTISKQLENPASKFADEVSKAQKIVFSRSLKKSKWINTTISNKLSETIYELKQSDGKNIIAYGGVEFASELIMNQLVDKFMFYVNPVLFGKGKSVFKSISKKMDLKQINAEAFSSGVVVLEYDKN